MVVDSAAVARELRRRKVGRSELLVSLDASSGETWLPGSIDKTPTPLLVLAAMSLARKTTPR